MRAVVFSQQFPCVEILRIGPFETVERRGRRPPQPRMAAVFYAVGALGEKRLGRLLLSERRAGQVEIVAVGLLREVGTGDIEMQQLQQQAA